MAGFIWVFLPGAALELGRDPAQERERRWYPQMTCPTGMREKNKICGVTRVGLHGHATALWRLALLGFFQRTIGSIRFQSGIIPQ